MASERTQLPVAATAPDDVVAEGWAVRSAVAVAEELAALCEELARRLQRAAAPAGEAADPVARTRLAYLYGAALLDLAERDRPALLPDAVRSLSDALSLARRHVPERVVTIKPQLLRAEHSLALSRAVEEPHPR
jgi:hypothetical protein